MEDLSDEHALTQAERSRSLRLVDPSPALRGACERLGLSTLLSSGDAA